MAVVPPPVMGKVAGFVIIRNGTERLEFATPEAFAAEVARVQEIERAFWRKYPQGCLVSVREILEAGIPSDEYFTQMCRDDNGVIEEEPGAGWKNTKIGDAFIKKFCHLCGGNPVWFRCKDGFGAGQFECETCTDKAIDSDQALYDGSQEREY